eukprot:SAG31_NODE_2671_length_5270_cov_5.903114_4_plen_135_part_00
MVDNCGLLVTSASHVIAFSIDSGPGRVSGVHNGDATSHEPQAATSRRAYHGLARATVAVTADAMAPHLLQQVETNVSSMWLGHYEGPQEIVVRAATIPSGILAGSSVRIMVSSNPADAVMAVASRGATTELQFT